MESELGGDVEGCVIGGGGHPDGVVVEPHLEVRLRVHRRVLRRLRAPGSPREQREDEEEEGRGHRRTLPPHALRCRRRQSSL